MTTLLRYLRTVRHLRFSQALSRLRFNAIRPSPDLAAAPPSRQLSATFVPPLSRPARLLTRDRGRFLNEEGDIGSVSCWHDLSREKLWLYNLHYFDDLSRLDARAWRDRHATLMHRWVAENPPSEGIGWEPYPLSLRVANWIKWALSGGTLDDVLRHSLAVQARHLSRRLEWHLLGNHLLANAKSLTLAGLYFAGTEADDWRRIGLRILGQQLDEQILPDGGHYERSPMYHAIVTEDVLDLVNMATAFGDALDNVQSATVARWRNSIPSMIAWLRAMTHPDGGISFFNDAALRSAASADELSSYAERLQIFQAPAERDGLLLLEQSGYARLTLREAVLFADVAPVGPDCNPGHAHADTLSFELSLFGQRVIVNGGTSRYGTGSERQFERSTAAHSTVEIDGENSSEVWAGFRVARRATPFGLSKSARADSLHLSCAHDGYRRLPGKPVHRRTWVLEAGVLCMQDEIEGQFRSAIARFHLHPGIAVSIGKSADAGTFLLPAGQEVRWRVIGGRASVRRVLYSPEFGKRVDSHCLEVRFNDAHLRTTLTW